MIQEMAYLTAAFLFIIGLYAVSFKDNIIKKVLGVTFITDAVNLSLVAMGYKPGGIVPIRLPNMDLSFFIQNSAYPLPMALVLTNIVIGVATVALILGLIIKIFNHTKSLSCRRIWPDE